MRDYFFPPIIFPLFLILVVLPIIVLFLIFAGSAVFEIVFGIESDKALLLFAMIVIGSLINIPLYEKKGVEVVRKYEIFGLIYTVRTRKKLIIAVNVGGCILPSILATKLLYDILEFLPILVFFVAFIISSLIIYGFAKPIAGVGIVVPMILPPLVATLTSFMALTISEKPLTLLPKMSFSVGVLSALFGADILHLRDIEKVGYGVVSIGGAGTFDGIFLTGVFAVLFSVFFI
ncbi:MAG: DUF1614 domain-containing protein [Archaeoglobaceae archaeon]|nr:DUF1614 domain-containing protein [Archaeoglobaceae archaeon]MDW7989757.1 DUF1614 domain-containing protein [Archaeoglobaceae archaeon]